MRQMSLGINFFGGRSQASLTRKVDNRFGEVICTEKIQEIMGNASDNKNATKLGTRYITQEYVFLTFSLKVEKFQT